MGQSYGEPPKVGADFFKKSAAILGGSFYLNQVDYNVEVLHETEESITKKLF